MQTCATLFRQFCLQHNLLDFSLQIEVFCSAVWELPQCRHYLGHSFSHLIFDNIEEDMPVAHDLLRHWLDDLRLQPAGLRPRCRLPQLFGRRPRSAYQLQELCDRTLEFPESLVASPAIQSLNAYLASALQGLPIPPADSPAQPQLPEIHIESADQAETSDSLAQSEINNQKSKIINLKSTRFYPQMLDWVSSTIAGLVHDQGLPAGEIVVLAPFLSDALRFSLIDRLQRQGVPARSHRPSRSLRDEPATQCLLTLAALAHPGWGVCPSRFDVAYALVQSIRIGPGARPAADRDRLPPEGQDSYSDLLRPDAPRAAQRITYRLGERFEKLRLWLEVGAPARR